ncbi:MAG: hypothetical protein MJ173_01180 [Clostridia bacterium]|nr:hypothetical protein [Clostridia bacterium]
MNIFRKYIIAVFICLCLTFSAVCITAADEAARNVYLGDKDAVFVLGTKSEKLGGNVTDLAPLYEEIKEIIKQASSIAPAPVNNIYWLYENIG